MRPAISEVLPTFTLAMLEPLAKAAESRMAFTAKRCVNSEAIAHDRRICLAGDKIEVIRWHCKNGPTEIIVTSRDLAGGQTCIPFSWVMEMGAPDDLESYMPIAPFSWPELIAEMNRRQSMTAAAEGGSQP